MRDGSYHNYENCNFFDYVWFKKIPFSTNPLAKLLSESGTLPPRGEVTSLPFHLL